MKIAADILWETMLLAIDGLLVVVDKAGYIEVISKAYAGFSGVSPKAAEGKHARDVIENTRMDIVIRTGKAELSEVRQIKGHRMIASRIPGTRHLQPEGHIAGRRAVGDNQRGRPPALDGARCSVMVVPPVFQVNVQTTPLFP